MKKRKMSQAWKNRIWNGSILAAFVAAMAVFVFLLQTEKRVLTEYEKEQVCVVTAAIPRGEKISAENAEQYITVMEIDKRIVPETALKSTEAASGRIAAYGVEQGMVLTTGCLLYTSYACHIRADIFCLCTSYEEVEEQMCIRDRKKTRCLFLVENFWIMIVN